MTRREQLAEQILGLPPEDRQYVLDLAAASSWDEPSPPDQQAFFDELDRRSDAYDRGETTALSLEEGMRYVREQLEIRRLARERS